MTAKTKNIEKRIGLFVCHCGVNIAGVVDVEKVAEVMKGYPGETMSTDSVNITLSPWRHMLMDES